jgi:tRNA-dihydrouridine synthase
LHARTAADYYGGTADWDAIARLKEAVTSVPVLGNGDIWSADDALEMVARTGCDGVVVGRGCLGRPWLFADLAAAFAGRPERRRPGLVEVVAVLRRHAGLLVQHYDDEGRGLRDLRKHVPWYLKGYPVGSELRGRLAMVGSLSELDDLVGSVDDCGYPGAGAEGPRGRTVGAKKVALPQGWLDDRELTGAAAAAVSAAEISVSGG